MVTARKRSKAEPTVSSSGPLKRSEPARRTVMDVVKEPSTLAGALMIVSQVLTAGPVSLANPATWSMIVAGVGLIFAREGKNDNG